MITKIMNVQVLYQDSYYFDKIRLSDKDLAGRNLKMVKYMISSLKKNIYKKNYESALSNRSKVSSAERSFYEFTNIQRNKCLQVLVRLITLNPFLFNMSISNSMWTICCLPF